MNISKRIKLLREDMGLTGAEVCKGIISPSHYSNIENGRFTPSGETLSLLASRLKVPKAYIINFSDCCPEIEKLLDILEETIEKGDISSFSLILTSKSKQFEFISSIEQEFRFNLLLFLYFINSNNLNQAITLYKKKLDRYHTDLSYLKIREKLLFLRVAGLYYYFVKDFEKSLQFFLEILELEVNKFLEARITFNIALIYNNMYQYRDALIYAERANNLYLYQHNWIKTGSCYNLLALLHRELKNYSEAEGYIKKGLSLVDGDSNSLKSRLYHNYALIKRDQGDYLSAIEYINKCLEIKREYNLPELFLSYSMKINTLFLVKDILEINKVLAESHNFIETTADEAQYLFLYAKVNFLLENKKLYEQSIIKSIKLFEQENKWKYICLASEHYSCYLEEDQKYKKALKYQKKCSLALKKLGVSSIEKAI